jgi:hypothetical protein
MHLAAGDADEIISVVDMLQAWAFSHVREGTAAAAHFFSIL